jgi:uncharacterized protein (TIGR03086 family)
MIDLEPAAKQMAQLVEKVSDDQLDRPTPCPDYTVGDLLDHIATLAFKFQAAARKDLDELATTPPMGSAARLADDWPERIPRDLAAMAVAWSEPDAWEGMTIIGGGDTPGEVCGLIGLDELIVHGWDIARATGQEFRADAASLEGARSVLLIFQVPGKQAEPGSPFGTPIEVPDDAPLLDQVLALSGRDPSWSPS